MNQHINPRAPRALLIVDVQPTFCEGGALAVAGGNALAGRIADYVRSSRDRYALIVTTQDWHVEPGAHFSPNPDYVDTWPPHGVAGTDEALLHPAIAGVAGAGLVDHSVKKGAYSAAYSGFEGHDDQGRSLESLLKAAGVEELDVVGIAESHCVCQTALDAVSLGFPTRVLSDLTVAVSPETAALAREHMDAAGVVRTVQAPRAAL